MDLLMPERQARIQALLQQNGRVLAVELAETFAVSEDTIRRDLREMAATGLCQRVYGGALAIGAPVKTLRERSRERVPQKRALAQALYQHIQPEMLIFLDVSSVNMVLAELLAVKPMRLTIVTNTPAIAALLADVAEIELIMIGGPVNSRNSACVGARALRDIESFNPDLCILGVCAVDAAIGLTADLFEDAEFKRCIAQRSRAVMLAVTGEKLGQKAAHNVLDLQHVTTMIVDTALEDGLLEPFAALSLHIERARSAEF